MNSITNSFTSIYKFITVYFSKISYRIRKTDGLPERQQKKERNTYRQQKCKSRLDNCVTGNIITILKVHYRVGNDEKD